MATTEAELARLDALYDRCRQNGLDPEKLNREELRELEPAVSGLSAIRVAESAITDYTTICQAMVQAFRERGGEMMPGMEVTGLREDSGRVRVTTRWETLFTRQLVVCGGLMADRLARMQGLGISFRTVPYRGEYYRLRAGLEGLVKHLIYPVPDPALPFLGVHLTPTVSGEIRVGPNAVQGWKREGYGRFNFSARDTFEMLTFPGFWKVSGRHLKHGLTETGHSLSKRAYLSRVRRYCPSLQAGDLLPSPAGIRAQAVLSDGTLMHDFLLERTNRTLHVCNAPSPAATSAIPIARHICDLLAGSG